MTMLEGRRAARPLRAPGRETDADTDAGATAPDVASATAGEHPSIEETRPTTTTSAGRTIATVLIALAVASLLCADSLVQVAERQPFGTTRDIALAIARPLRSLSHATGLHLPRLWLAELTDNEPLPASAAGEDIAVEPITAPPATSPPVAVTTPPWEVTSTTIPIPTTTTLPPRRVPTAEAPLRVAMFGDSTMGQLSGGVGRLVRDDPRLHVDADVRVSTGLARPDVLDWPAYLAEQVPALNAEVVFLAFGANDDQAMHRADGSVAALFTPEWREEYARRVALAMDVAGQGDRTVVWIGLPAEAPERLNAVKDTMNEVAREQAAIRPRVVYVDLGSLLTPDGQYTDTFTFPDGSAARVRERDGVHLSVTGGDVVAPTLFGAIAAQWNLG